MSKLRFALIGCGVIHATHLGAIDAIGLENAELVAVCDEVPGLAQTVADARGGIAAFTSLDEMLAQADFDALAVCTPSGLHAKHGVQGAKAGKHIVCEKPIDVSLEAADALISACRDNNVKLVVISQSRYSSGMTALKHYLDSGRLGDICYGEAVTKWYRSQQYYDSGGWRGTWALDGGGALMNQGVHFVDQLRWVMGPVKSVAATMATRAHERIEVEDIVSASIEFESGAVGTLLASTAMFPGYKQAIEVYGVNGTVIVDNSRLRHAQFATDSDGQKPADGKTPAPEVKDFEPQTPEATALVADADKFKAQGASDPRAIALDGHIQHYLDLLGAIRENRDTFMSGAEARAALELIVGVYRSAKSGERVHFPL